MLGVGDYATHLGNEVARNKRTTKFFAMHLNDKVITGIIIGLIVAIVLIFYVTDMLPGGIKTAAFALTTALFFVILLLLMSLYLKDKFLKKVFGRVDSSQNIITEASVVTEEVSKNVIDFLLKDTSLQVSGARQILPKVVNAFIWSKVRNWWLSFIVAILAIIGGLISTVILLNQNELIENQNEKIEIQSNLMEADRRSSMVILMSAVLSDLNSEISNQKIDTTNIEFDERLYNLSNTLIGRISGLSQGLRPYRFFVDGELTKYEYSVERGQLLLAIANSNLSHKSMNLIADKTNFNNSYLDGARLQSLFLNFTNLSNSTFVGADLSEADLSGTNLARSIMRKATLSSTLFFGANLSSSDFSGADFGHTKFRQRNTSEYSTVFQNANLDNAIFNDVDLSGVDFLGASLKGVNLKNINFEDAILGNNDLRGNDLSNMIFKSSLLINMNLSGSNLKDCNFSDSNMMKTKFNGANLQGVNFYNTNLSMTNFTDAKNISVEQLLQCETLFMSIGLEEQTKIRLAEIKPCLFTGSACE